MSESLPSLRAKSRLLSDNMSSMLLKSSIRKGRRSRMASTKTPLDLGLLRLNWVCRRISSCDDVWPYPSTYCRLCLSLFASMIMPRSKPSRFSVIANTALINLSMSMMVEVACPISWTNMALLYRTSLSRRVSSPALRWSSMVFTSALLSSRSDQNAQSPTEMEAIRVRKHQ